MTAPKIWMSPSQACIDFIKKHETLKLEPYQDEGRWAVGWGHDLKPGEPVKAVTETQAAAYLIQDMSMASAVVNRAVRAPLTQNQFDALIDFVFNVGGSHFVGSSLLKKLNVGDYVGAAEEFKRWNMAGGKVSQALVKRREEEASLFKEGGKMAVTSPETSTTTSVPLDKGSNAVHSKVAVPTFVGAATSFILHILKMKYNIDLSDQETNLIVIIMAFSGWLVPA